jgi:nucleoside-diphosphate-sugar epimerase
MKVLLTGATGFVGNHAARALIRGGHEVWATVRADSDRARIADIEPELHLIEHDLLRDGVHILAAIEPELCVHTAWYTEPGRYLTARVNVDLVAASARLALALADGGCRRFVGVGTCFEYDVDRGQLSEETPPRPRHLYSASKLSLFLLLEQIEPLTGMETAWARLFYMYGPHEDERRLVASVARALLRGERVDVTPGEQIRDFLHIEHVGTALTAIALTTIRGAVNVGSGEPVTVREIVETLSRLAGRDDLISLGARPYPDDEPMVVYANTDRLRGNVGWRASYTLAAGLAATVAWWRGRIGPV